MKQRMYQGRLTTFLLVSVLSIFLFSGGKVSADATTNPRVQMSDLQYLGAFRIPINTSNDFSYANDGLAYNAANNSLFVKCIGASLKDPAHQKIAEINIPTLVNSSSISSLNTATVRQDCADITEGNKNQEGLGNGIVMGGLLVYNNKLIGAEWGYYDPAGQQTKSHFKSGLTLSTTGDFGGLYTVGTSYPSFVGGYMTTIPSQWQSALGGPALTGHCCTSIISRQSLGPAAFVFDPDKLGVQNPVPATPVVYYDYSHPMLGNWGHPLPANPIYNISTLMTGIVFPEGTRSILFFGRTGLGEQCYGEGRSSGGNIDGTYCYDPAYVGNKGTHAYPYGYYVWAYDANDFAAVKNGTKNPWDITPYSSWELDLPFDTGRKELNGATYDPVTKKIYVSQYCVDNSPVYCLPIIHAFSMAAQVTPDTESPTWPTGTTFSANATSSSSITVTWSAATDNIAVSNYLVERCQGSGCSNFSQVGTPTSSPFLDSGLTPNTFYNYHVRAVDAAGNFSNWSNVVGATTQSTIQTLCNTVTPANFSQSAYNSYGAPFDPYQTSVNLMGATCTSADPHTVNATLGVSGDTTRIVYTKGYWYDPATAGWRQYTGTCTGALNGDWCQGAVSATITDANVSTANAANPTYFVGMVCRMVSGSWKCGCRDTNCTNFYWQIQGASL